MWPCTLRINLLTKSPPAAWLPVTQSTEQMGPIVIQKNKLKAVLSIINLLFRVHARDFPKAKDYFSICL